MLDAAAKGFDALVFDIGGVIVSHDNEAMYRQIASRCAGSPPTQEVKAVIRRTRWSLGLEPMSSLHERLQTELGYDGDWSRFVEDWTCHFTADRSMAALAAGLARTQRVILFSNTNAVHGAHEIPGMEELAEVERCLSCDLGLVKPAPEAFLKVAELAGIDPRRSLMIDDLPENVRGAQEAGFQGLLFQGEAELRQALLEAGVVIGEGEPA